MARVSMQFAGTGHRRPAGYAALVERFDLDVIPNWHASHVLLRGIRRRSTDGSTVTEDYPATYWPGDGFGDHLEFALKYDGTNLGVLATLFDAVAQSEVLAYVRSKPMGMYARRTWYLYEFLTGRRLPLEDLPLRGSYVDLLDPTAYHTPPPNQLRRGQPSVLHCRDHGTSRYTFA